MVRCYKDQGTWYAVADGAANPDDRRAVTVVGRGRDERLRLVDEFAEMLGHLPEVLPDVVRHRLMDGDHVVVHLRSEVRAPLLGQRVLPVKLGATSSPLLMPASGSLGYFGFLLCHSGWEIGTTLGVKLLPFILNLLQNCLVVSLVLRGVQDQRLHWSAQHPFLSGWIR